ncbi:MAG: HD domain-containing protein [Lewinellaceae bacterium]|nr:HD domain-containing protein [Lewinellaceae bacterium]MCB9291499.1 HD domain-containing protein [Lewinellaceae bacterium]
MTRDEAYTLLTEMTETESLLRHARTVELVMRALARHFEEDEEKFAVTGLLHDADYEKYPDQHPGVIVARLRERGEEEIAHAIAGHYTKWNVPRNSLLDKCIVAADELTGFIYAAALIRPTRIEGMNAKSVLKKLKTKSFAASVDREEVRKGAELLGWELRELIDFIIPVLEAHKEELELGAP